LRAILVVDCGSKKVSSIERAVFQEGFEPRVVRMNELKDVGLKSYAAIIISGSPTLLMEINHDTYVELLSFIRNVSCPVWEYVFLGICFGHQVIGLVYGVNVFRGPGRRTPETIYVVQRNRLLEGLERTFYMDEDHCEGITLPDQFILLARSGSYDVEAMKHRDKNVYGVQFHPESSGELGRRIIRSFPRLCSPETLSQSSRS